MEPSSVQQIQADARTNLSARILCVVLMAVLGLAILPPSMWGDQIAFGYSATSAMTGPTLLNGETQSIGNGTDIWMYLKGNAVSTSPILLIIGVPNDPAVPPNHNQLSAGSITGYTLRDSSQSLVATGNPVEFSGGTGYSSITTHNTFGFAGDFNSGDLYNDFFGISSITASNQFQSNWQAWDHNLFPTVFPGSNNPMNFGIYVFGLTFPGTDTFSSKTNPFIEVHLGSALPEGSYAVGYSIDSSSKSGADNFTPFTVAGLDNQAPPTPPVPEPASLVLFGTGLLSLSAAVRRRRK